MAALPVVTVELAAVQVAATAGHVDHNRRSRSHVCRRTIDFLLRRLRKQTESRNTRLSTVESHACR